MGKVQLKLRLILQMLEWHLKYANMQVLFFCGRKSTNHFHSVDSDMLRYFSIITMIVSGSHLRTMDTGPPAPRHDYIGVSLIATAVEVSKHDHQRKHHPCHLMAH